MIRRTAYAFLYLEDELSPDLADLLRAKAPDPAARARVLALCLLTGERHALQREELDTLLAIPVSRWVAPGAHDPAVVERLCGRGLLLSDGSDGRAQALVERDAALSRNQWNLYAAL